MIDPRSEVLIDKHVFEGTLPNGDAVYHECDGRDCRLREELRQMEREREGKR